MRILLFIPEVFSPITTVIGENKDVGNDFKNFKDGNEGFKDPGRRRPESLLITILLENDNRVKMFRNSCTGGKNKIGIEIKYYKF